MYLFVSLFAITFIYTAECNEIAPNSPHIESSEAQSNVLYWTKNRMQAAHLRFLTPSNSSHLLGILLVIFFKINKNKKNKQQNNNKKRNTNKLIKQEMKHNVELTTHSLSCQE